MSEPAQTTQGESAPRFAHVALPVHLRKLFTYRVPTEMQDSARVGSRVVVRLGNKPTTGYIVALLQNLRQGTSLIESELKEVEELLDVEPSLTPEVVEVTRWVAEYYGAPLGEVMRAALPAGINTSIMQVVAITATGREALSQPGEMNSEPPASAGGQFVEIETGLPLTETLEIDDFSSWPRSFRQSRIIGGAVMAGGGIIQADASARAPRGSSQSCTA